jgi:hypothetical protein
MKKQCFMAAYGNSGTSECPPATPEDYGCKECAHRVPHNKIVNISQYDGVCRKNAYPWSQNVNCLCVDVKEDR